MKKIAIAALLTAASLTASAQDIFDNPDNHAYFGVRLSYELASPTDVTTGNYLKIDMLDASSGFAVSGVYNMPVWKNLYFEPGLTVSYNTVAYNKTFVNDLLEDELNVAGIRIDNASVRRWAFRIPMIVGYHFDFTPDVRVSLFTGPEFELGLSAKAHIKSGDMTLTQGAYGKDKMLNRCDVKWRFGVGATFMDHYYAAVSGAAGICDMAQGPEKMRINLFDISLGYNF